MGVEVRAVPLVLAPPCAQHWTPASSSCSTCSFERACRAKTIDQRRDLSSKVVSEVVLAESISNQRKMEVDARGLRDVKIRFPFDSSLVRARDGHVITDPKRSYYTTAKDLWRKAFLARHVSRRGKYHGVTIYHFPSWVVDFCLLTSQKGHLSKDLQDAVTVARIANLKDAREVLSTLYRTMYLVGMYTSEAMTTSRCISFREKVLILQEEVETQFLRMEEGEEYTVIHPGTKRALVFDFWAYTSYHNWNGTPATSTVFGRGNW